MKYRTSFSYIFKKALQHFCITFIYVVIFFSLIDTISTSLYNKEAASILNQVRGTLILKLDFLLTLTFAISTAMTFSLLKTHNEVKAFLVAGFTKKKILTPFYLLAFLLMTLSYLNAEYGVPYGYKWNGEDPNSVSYRKKMFMKFPVESVTFSDKTRIVFQTNTSGIFDVFWIHSPEEIWHIQSISYDIDSPTGELIDVFKKNDNRSFEKIASFERLDLPETFRTIQRKPRLTHANSLSHAYKLMTKTSLISSADKGKFKTTFYYKLISPLLFFLLLTLLAPSLFKEERKHNVYKIYFSAVGFFLLLQALLEVSIILGENYILSPAISLLLFPLILQGLFSYRLLQS